MDRLPYIPTREDRIVAYHEAGHAVVALALGFEVLEIDCHEKDKATAKINILAPYAKKGLKQYIVDRIAILAAGAMVQCHCIEKEDTIKDSFDYVFIYGNGRLDGMKAIELANTLRNVSASEIVTQGLADKEINNIFDQAYDIIEDIVNNRNGAEAIEKIAGRMLEKIAVGRSDGAQNDNGEERAVIEQGELLALACDLKRTTGVSTDLTTG